MMNYDIQPDLAMTDLVITETFLYRTLFKALSSKSHLVVTDKLKFWWSRYNGNLVLHVRYSKVYMKAEENLRSVKRPLLMPVHTQYP